MKTIGLLGFLAAFSCLAEPVCAAAVDSDLAAAIYNHARHRNRLALERMQRSGFPLDAVDADGNTALCTAMLRRDENAYNLLRQLGANPAHPCVKRLEAAVRPVDSELLAWNIGPTTYLGAAVLTGGIIAAAASGGGGGGGGSGGDGGTGTEGGEDGPGGTGEAVYPMEPAEFETEEYAGGHFLPQINASAAYARYYSKTDSGEIVSSLEPVGVGVVDSGVYGAHPAFAQTEMTGVNYDYGPCQNGDTTNCWRYAAEYEYQIPGKDGPITQVAHNVAYLVRDNGELYLSQFDPVTGEEDFNDWAAAYDEGYDWDAVKDSSTSYYPNSALEDSHGTHVAGIIAGNKDDDNMHGVAFENAAIIAARWDLMSPIDDPVRDVIDLGAEVVNFSLGVDASALLNAALAPALEEYVSDYLDIVRYQIENNVVFVMAAGNEGYSQPGILNGLPLLEEFKESLDGLFITVVAVDGKNQIADFSNRCGVTQGYCLAAPGVDVISAIAGQGPNGEYYYASMDGTSMAAPVVTGSVAFLLGAYPYLTPQEVVHLLFETATDLGDPGVDEVYGHGLVNLGAAAEPQGELEIATSDSVDGSFVPVRTTSMSVPAVFKSAMLAKMPAKLTVFDKYKRPYAMPMASLIRTTHSGERNFKNDLYAFSRYQAKRTVDAGNGLSFSFAPAALSTSPTGLGTMEVRFDGGNGQVTGFYYTENTLYNHDRYFEKTLANPFMAMNLAYGVYNSYALGEGLRATFGFATGENGLYDGSEDDNDREFDDRAYGLNSEVSWKATENFTLTATSGVLYEDNALLGLNGTGGFDVGDSGTYYAGLVLTWSPLQNFYLSGAWYQGWTDAGSLASDLMQTGRLMSDSFALDAYWQYNRTDVVGLQFSSPLRIYKGKARFNLPVGRDNYSDAVYRESYSASLKPDAREYRFSLYHDRQLNEDMSLKLQADMRLNPDHQKDAETDYRVMFGFSWTFN